MPDDHGGPHRDLTPHEQARDNAGGAFGVPFPDLDPNSPTHRADYYLPLIWTLFLFILVCNLLGMIPFSGSPTSSLAVTSVLSLITFIVIHTAGVKNNGWDGYAKSFVPKVDGLPKIMSVLISAGVACIEVMSLFIRNIVLAVRLFANMVGGHTALFLMLLFIQLIGVAAAENKPYADLLFYPVTLGSLFLVIAMSLLEIFVALLQAYVFAMLTATFIGLAVAPEH
jgi:F-type H+-transporting ATPase subunit a